MEPGLNAADRSGLHNTWPRRSSTNVHFFSIFFCAIFIFRKGEARRKRRRADLNTGVAGPRSEARPRFQAECSLPGGKRQPDAKEHLERAEGSSAAGKCRCHHAQPRPGLPSRRVCKGGEAGGEGAELGVGAAAAPGFPFPSAPAGTLHAHPCRVQQRRGARSPLSPLRAGGGPRPPRRHARSRERAGSAPRPHQPPRRGFACAEPTRQPPGLQSGQGCTKRNAAEGRRGGSHPAAGERRERARALVPETLRELQTLPSRAARAPHRGSGRPRFPVARPPPPRTVAQPSRARARGEDAVRPGCGQPGLWGAGGPGPFPAA